MHSSVASVLLFSLLLLAVLYTTSAAPNRVLMRFGKRGDAAAELPLNFEPFLRGYYPAEFGYEQ